MSVIQWLVLMSAAISFVAMAYAIYTRGYRHGFDAASKKLLSVNAEEKP